MSQAVDIQGLIAALDERVDEMANRAYDVLLRLVPDARQWTGTQQAAFIEQARSRFLALLAVTEHGAEVDEALRRDLQEVGAQAVNSGSSLSQLLIGFRISRDVLLQVAMRLAEEDADRWNSTLLTFSQRMLPAIDRLTDSITAGYWKARLGRSQDALHRFESLVEGIPYGIYEVDIDGLIRFANPALAGLCGRSGENLEGFPLNGVLKPADGAKFTLLDEPTDDVAQTSLLAIGPEGSPVTFDIDMVVRRVDGVVVGFAGLVRQAGPVGVSVDLTPLVRHIYELRRSIEILNDAGEFIHRNAELMTPDQINEAGESVSRQAQRLMVIVDELDADRRAIQPRQV